MKRTLPALASLALAGAAAPTFLPGLANAAATVRGEAAEPAPPTVLARRAEDGGWSAYLLDRAVSEAPCEIEAAEPCGQPLADAGLFLQFDGGEPVEGRRLQLEQHQDELLLQAVSPDGEEVLLVGRARLETDLLAPSVEMNLEPGWEWLRQDPGPLMPGRLVLSHSHPEPLLALADDPAPASDSPAPLLARRPVSRGLSPLEAALQGVNRGSTRSSRTSSPAGSSGPSLGRSPVADNTPSGVVSLQVIPFED